LNIAKLLPSPRRGVNNANGIGPLTPGPFSPGGPIGVTSPYDAGRDSPFNPASKTPFPGQPSRFGAPGTPVPGTSGAVAPGTIERQTCIL